jgi:hypothetical protein
MWKVDIPDSLVCQSLFIKTFDVAPELLGAQSQFESFESHFGAFPLIQP